MNIRYYCYALLTILIWTGNTIVSKLAAGLLDPGILAFGRGLVAFTVLTPFVWLPAYRERHAIWRHWPKLAILGVLGMALSQGLGHYAAVYTSATNMGILFSLVPMFTIAVSSILLREKPKAYAVFGSLLALNGIFLLLGKGNPTTLFAEGIGRGDAIMLFSTIALALYGVLLRLWSIPLSPWVSIYAQVAFSCVALIPAFILTVPSPATMPNIMMVLYAGIPASVVAPFVWMQAIKHLGPSRTTIFMNLLPIMTALVAAVFLNERLHFFHLVGGGLTLAGVALAQRKGASKRRVETGHLVSQQK